MGMIFGLVGAGISWYSQRQAGETQAAIARYNADIQRNAAVVAEQDRAQAARDNAREAQNAQKMKDRQLAALRARYAGGGIVPDVGTPVVTLAEAAFDLELGIEEINRRGAYQQEDLTRTAANYRQQSVLTNLQGQAARQCSRAGATSSLFSNLSRTFDPRYGSSFRTGLS